MAAEPHPPARPWGPHELATQPAADAVSAPRLNATDFLAAQRANRRNTRWLILILLALGGSFGYVLGLFIDAYAGDPAVFDIRAVSAIGLLGAAIFVGIGGIASLVTFMSGDRIMVRLTGAREVTPDEEPVLHNVVEEMAIAAGLPKPRVVVIETDAMNAFATGMKPARAALGVTRGLLKGLSRDELQGVIGHEMSHIANWDTRYMTAVGILVGLIVLVADGVRRSLFYGSMGGSGRRRDDRRGSLGPLIVILIVFSILAPIAAVLVRFAVTRQREYLADATSVRLTRNPTGLIQALQKLQAAAEPFRGANRATQHMFIVNPFRNFDEGASALIATHPPIAKRIERLQNLGVA
jgi:heat shock protein HtpX